MASPTSRSLPYAAAVSMGRTQCVDGTVAISRRSSDQSVWKTPSWSIRR